MPFIEFLTFKLGSDLVEDLAINWANTAVEVELVWQENNFLVTLSPPNT